MRRTAGALALILVLVSCSSGPDRSDVVTAIAGEALVPLVTSAADELDRLATSVEGMCSEPSSDALELVQSAWLAAKSAWERSEVTVYYGPAPMLRTESKVDFEPVSPDGIEELLASDAVIDFDYVDNRSAASRRGLGAIEYLIFRPLDEAAEQRRCELAISAAQVAAAAAGEVATSWTEPDGDVEAFSVVFTEVMEANASLADVVGAQFEILNRQTLFELGEALGVTSTESHLEALAEGPAGAGVDRYLAQLGGIEDTLAAGGDASLIELIRSRSDQVAADIEERLASAIQTLETIDGTMTDAVVEEPEQMSALLDDLSALRDLIHVDVVSLLDLTLGFSDSDGDSG